MWPLIQFLLYLQTLFSSDMLHISFTSKITRHCCIYHCKILQGNNKTSVSLKIIDSLIAKKYYKIYTIQNRGDCLCIDWLNSASYFQLLFNSSQTYRPFLPFASDEEGTRYFKFDLFLKKLKKLNINQTIYFCTFIAGLKESANYTHYEMEIVHQIMDEIRKQIGMKYPDFD